MGTAMNPEMLKDIMRKYNIDTCTISSDYELEFDEAINVKPTIVDFNTVKLFDKCRQDIQIVSFYDASLASSLQPMKISINLSGRNSVSTAEPIKQIKSLFDPDIMGRKIDLAKYGLCHYCKQIKSLDQLLKCSFKTIKSDRSEEHTSELQ